MNSCSIRDELGKVEQMVKRHLDDLGKWIPDRIKFFMSDSDLVLFLHRNYYDVEKSKKNIEQFFSLRPMMPELFGYRKTVLSSGSKDIFKNVSVVVLPKCTPEGYAVVLFQLLNYDPNSYDLTQAVKYLNMVLDVHIYETGISPGYLFVCDIKGSTPEHFDRLAIQWLAKYFYYLNVAAHFRWIGIHYVNSDSNDEVMTNYVKSKIVDAKLDKKVFLHTNIKCLANVVPVELLPVEMGGSAGHLQELHEAQVKKIQGIGKKILIEFEEK